MLHTFINLFDFFFHFRPSSNLSAKAVNFLSHLWRTFLNLKSGDWRDFFLPDENVHDWSMLSAARSSICSLALSLSFHSPSLESFDDQCHASNSYGLSSFSVSPLVSYFHFTASLVLLLLLLMCCGVAVAVFDRHFERPWYHLQTKFLWLPQISRKHG